jgi:hypothetical protein
MIITTVQIAINNPNNNHNNNHNHNHNHNNHNNYNNRGGGQILCCRSTLGTGILAHERLCVPRYVDRVVCRTVAMTDARPADLKPENILLHSSGHIMLTDFDLSKQATVPVQAKIYMGM